MLKIFAIPIVLISFAFNTYAQNREKCSAMNNESAKINEIIGSKRSSIINSHGLPRVKDADIENVLSATGIICVIEEFDVLTSHSYEKVIRQSATDKKVYLVYTGGISGNDRHVFGPLTKD